MPLRCFSSIGNLSLCPRSLSLSLLFPARERPKKTRNSLCLVAVRPSDQHVAAEGHEVEGRARHLLFRWGKRRRERERRCRREDARRPMPLPKKLARGPLTSSFRSCSFKPRREKRRSSSSALEPVRAPVDARRPRAKLKHLPLCF